MRKKVSELLILSEPNAIFALNPWAHLPKSIFMVDWTLFSLLKATNTYYLTVEECLLFMVQNAFCFFNLFEPLNRGTSFFIPPTQQPLFIPVQMLRMWEGLSKTENQGAPCNGSYYLRESWGGQEGKEEQRESEWVWERENAFSFSAYPWRFLSKKSAFVPPQAPTNQDA